MFIFTLISVSRLGVEPMASTTIYYTISSTDIIDLFGYIEKEKSYDNVK